MHKITYTTDIYTSEYEPDEHIELKIYYNLKYVKWIAEEAAIDFFNNYGGDDEKWPIEFSIFHEGKLLGKHKIDKRMEPVFYAVKNEAEKCRQL
jgi:hypothetical protein